MTKIAHRILRGVVDPMERGRFARPVRRGDTVERRSDGGNPNVHALLRHFERVGFELAPRFLGHTTDGTREVLGYLEGETGYPPLAEQLRSEAALVSVARAVRATHDASQGFEPPDPAGWHALEVTAPLRIDCVGHRDLAPWNIVFDGTDVVGIIDWDSAGPSNRVWDLCYAAHQFVPFHQPSHLGPFGWTEQPDRAARLRMFAEAYGAGVEPAELLDLAIVRLTSIAAHIEARVRAGDPDFDVHRDERHADGYRNAASYVIESRDAWLR